MILPDEISSDTFPFIYVVRVPTDRTSFRDHLSQNGIDTGIHWQPGHQFSYFSDCRKGDLSVTEEIGEQILTLPMYPDLRNENLKKITQEIKKSLGNL